MITLASGGQCSDDRTTLCFLHPRARRRFDNLYLIKVNSVFLYFLSELALEGAWLGVRERSGAHALEQARRPFGRISVIVREHCRHSD